MTSIMATICDIVPPSGTRSVEPSPYTIVLVPQMSAVNRSNLNAKAPTTRKVTNGTTLAMVTITLTTAASLHPRRTRKCTTHSTTEVTRIAGAVLPPAKDGKNVPSAEPSSTRNATLPIHAPTQ